MPLNQEVVDIPKFDITAFLAESNPLLGIAFYNWVIWLVIFVFLTYIYNRVFRTAKLTLLKNAIVYVLLALGAFMLLIFEVDANLPIVYSLGIAVILILIVRIRYWIEQRAGKRNGETTEESGTKA